MQITVNVADIDLDTVIGERIEEIEPGEYEGGSLTLRDAVADVIARRAIEADAKDGWPLRNRIDQVRNEVLRDLLTPILTKALEEPLTPTNAWGQPTGQPATTLAEIITKQFRETLSERVDDRGQTGYLSDRKTFTRLEWMIGSSVQAVVAKELAAELEKAKAALREQLQAVAAAKLAETVAAR